MAKKIVKPVKKVSKPAPKKAAVKPVKKASKPAPKKVVKPTPKKVVAKKIVQKPCISNGSKNKRGFRNIF